MPTDPEELERILQNGSESLKLELKRWFDPHESEGVAKIVKSCIALRNNNGGKLVIGYDSETRRLDSDNCPENIEKLFDADKIQATIAHYSSLSFEIEIEYIEIYGCNLIVITAPPGVTIPVAARRDLRGSGGSSLIKVNAVYVRSLDSNNSPSTTEAIWKDWGRIVEICFENREADIGRFIRRHLGGTEINTIRSILGFEVEVPEKTREADRRAHLLGFLDENWSLYENRVKERGLSSLLELGTWEVGLIIRGPLREYTVNRSFLRLLENANPELTGWPVWLDSRGFHDETSRPRVVGDAWEAFVVSPGDDFLTDHVDFIREYPSGMFYLLRILQDDQVEKLRSVEPLKCLDFGLIVIRTAEALAVGLSFAGAMTENPADTELQFACRWKKLAGRELASWANPGRHIHRGQIAQDDMVISNTSFSADVSPSALAPYVRDLVAPAFSRFDGFELSEGVYEDLVQRLLERRLS